MSSQEEEVKAVVHVVTSESTMFSGSSLVDCQTWDDPTCQGGVATVAALLRHTIPSNESKVVIPFARTEEVFDQMHPLSWAVWRLILNDYYGYNVVTCLPSVLLQNKADSGNGLDLQDFQSHQMPLLFTNVNVPPTNSWSEFIKHVHFDSSTGLAILWLSSDGQVFQTDPIDTAKKMLDYIHQINVQNGCYPNISNLYRDQYCMDSSTRTTCTAFPVVKEENENEGEGSFKCWTPIVFLYAEKDGLWEQFLDAVAINHDHPPAVIFGRYLGFQFEDGTTSQIYRLPNNTTTTTNDDDIDKVSTWIVEYKNVDLYKHFALTLLRRRSSDGSFLLSSEVRNVQDILTTTTPILQSGGNGDNDLDGDLSQMVSPYAVHPDIYKDEQWKLDIAYLRQLADEAISYDPVVGQSTFMPVTRDDSKNILGLGLGIYRGCMRGECEIGNLFTDAFRWKVDADIAFMNSGGIRGPGWPAGDVHISDIWAAFPFPNILCVGMFSGISLFKLFDYSIAEATFMSHFTEHGDRLMQISGLKIVYNTQLKGSRIVSIDVWDKQSQSYKPLERLKLYKFVASNYMVFGMHPFPSFLGENFVLEGEVPGTLTDFGVQAVVAEYLSQLDEPYQVGIQGRLVNNTNITEPLSLIQTEESCPLDSYWDKATATCYSCVLASNVAFSTPQQTYQANFGEDIEVIGEALLFNSGSDHDVLIKPKVPPYFIELLTSSGGEELHPGMDPILLKAGTGTAIKYKIHSSRIRQSGSAQGPISIALVDDGRRPGCLSEDASIVIQVDVSPETEYNYLGQFRLVGFSLLAVAVVLTLLSCIFVWINRTNPIIKMHQPGFLLLIGFGIIVMVSSLLPLSFDDEIISQTGCDIACNAIPWLMSLGFTITFAALFSKLWRINKIISGAIRCRRVFVHWKDVLVPFAVLFAFNFAFLLTSTLADPLTWERHHDPIQPWNSYGKCTADDDSPISKTMLGLTGTVNAGALLLACHQAWNARLYGDNFSEANYLGIALLCWLQIVMVGVPVMFLMDDDNIQAKYFITITLIFAVSMSMLLIIFFPTFLEFYRGKDKPPERRTSNSRVSTASAGKGLSGGSADKGDNREKNQRQRSEELIRRASHDLIQSVFQRQTNPRNDVEMLRQASEEFMQKLESSQEFMEKGEDGAASAASSCELDSDYEEEKVIAC